MFERKIPRMIFGLMKDRETGEWEIRKNQKPKTSVGWTCYAKPEPYHKNDHGREPGWKIPLGRPCLRWEDVIRNDLKTLNGGQDWKVRATDRECWRTGCVMG